MEPDFILPPDSVAPLQAGRWVYPTGDAVFHLTGPGTIDCLQGVLTNDIVKPGAQALVWGALLTPKGMIITDLWVKRDGDAAWLIIPRTARDTVKQLLAKTFPPRLTKVLDRTDDVHVWWLVAPSTPEVEIIEGAILPHEIAPFSALVITTNQLEADTLDQHLGSTGWGLGDVNWASAKKVIAEWPTLGREIDEKTLVQEVRFDELQGVKYDKGCFTGQETVARLHFRGHANKQLRRIPLIETPRSRDILVDDKLSGRITTWGILGEEIVALAKMKRSV